MAVNLATAKSYYQSHGAGVTPDPNQPFDQWVLSWFTNAVDAGDPAAVKASGGKAAEEGEGGIADWQDAAPSSEWLGKRVPSPRELRRYANESGQSEDYQRFDDRQLAAWLKSNWNVEGGYFTNDYGDRVEKPTESGPQSTSAGSPTGEKGGGGRGGGGDGGKGKQAAPPPNQGAPGQLRTTGNPLQDALINMFNQQGGIMGGQKNLQGVSLSGGGLMWGNDLVNALKNKPTVPQTGTITPTSGMRLPTGPLPMGGRADPNQPLPVWNPGTPGPPGAPGVGGRGGPGGAVTNAFGGPGTGLTGALAGGGYTGWGGQSPLTPAPQPTPAPTSLPNMLQPASSVNALTPVMKRLYGGQARVQNGRWWL